MEGYGITGSSWFDRNGFPPALVALFWVVIALILFQGIGTVLVVVMILIEDKAITPEALAQYTEVMLLGNTIGQVVGLCLATLLFAKLSFTPFEYKKMMRFRMPEGTVRASVFAVILVVCIQPVIWLLSWVNQLVPFPDFLTQTEAMQLELLESMFTSGIPLWFLILSIGVVPAVCEEVLFRSYLLRLFEKSAGVIAAILITGFLFSAFHMRVTQFLPLAFIGIILAWITVHSGSIIPAIVLHFFHNSATVLAVHFYPDLIEMDAEGILPPVWLILSGLLLSGFLVYWYNYIFPKKPEAVHDV